MKRAVSKTMAIQNLSKKFTALTGVYAVLGDCTRRTVNLDMLI